MRELSEKEKELNNKSIERLKERNKDIMNYYLPQTYLELDHGLKISIEKTKKQYKEAISQWNDEIKRNDKQINILIEQNEKGVEEKKISGVN